MTSWNYLFHTRLLAVNMGLYLLLLLSTYFTADGSARIRTPVPPSSFFDTFQNYDIDYFEEEEALLFSVELRMPRYVPVNGSAVLRCAYNVPLDQLHKVEWLHHNNKMFQFVRNRKPPFRVHTITGAVLDTNLSNEREIFLKDMQLAAAGSYSCEVSTQTPIFTKTSNDEELVVVLPQRGAPEVHVRQSSYTVGELLEANCTSRPTYPVPHVTWLLNGDTVPDVYLRMIPNQHQGEGENLSSTTVTLTMPVQFEHAGANNKMYLACIVTIPAFMGLQTQPAQYADYERVDVSVEVVEPEIPSGQDPLTPLTALYVFLLILGSQRCLLQWR